MWRLFSRPAGEHREPGRLTWPCSVVHLDRITISHQVTRRVLDFTLNGCHNVPRHTVCVFLCGGKLGDGRHRCERSKSASLHFVFFFFFLVNGRHVSGMFHTSYFKCLRHLSPSKIQVLFDDALSTIQWSNTIDFDDSKFWCDLEPLVTTLQV